MPRRVLSPSRAPFWHSALHRFNRRVFGQRIEGVQQRVVVIYPLFNLVGAAALVDADHQVLRFAGLGGGFQIERYALQSIGDRVGAALDFRAVDDDFRILAGHGLLHRGAAIFRRIFRIVVEDGAELVVVIDLHRNGVFSPGVVELNAS